MLDSMRADARALGWSAYVAYATARALDRLSRGRVQLLMYRLVAQPIVGQPRVPARAPARAEFKRIQRDDPRVAQLPPPTDGVARRFANANLCFGAAVDGGLTGFIWIAERQYLEEEARCLFRLDPATSAVWDYDVYVRPDLRAGRLFGRLWDYVNATLWSSGYRWSISRISAFNAASLAAHRRLDAQTLGTFAFLAIGRVQVSFGSIAPYFHLALSASSFLTVRLSPPRDGHQGGATSPAKPGLNNR
jgi:hypothetical protein